MLTSAEVCERLRIDKKTLFKRIQDGDITAVKVGPGRNAGYRISEEALAEFLERNTVKPGEPEPAA